MIRYLSGEEILILHALIVDATGGTHGVRDVGLLTSLVEGPKATFGAKELYPDIYTKAAVLTESIVNYHVFVDGNKRTAFMVLGRFLSINSYELHATNTEVEETMVAIAEKKMDKVHMAEWIKVHVSSLSK